ncbi:hypothetical protein HHI36_020150 [Cryptolaemus montrouzieri]|uniref:Uncharacterized protein n=1 Tax=Cryptolaemus montrouzieri TaxID=559131 RepID=A0ABD2N9N0_9CUCU
MSPPSHFPQYPSGQEPILDGACTISEVHVSDANAFSAAWLSVRILIALFVNPPASKRLAQWSIANIST